MPEADRNADVPTDFVIRMRRDELPITGRTPDSTERDSFPTSQRVMHTANKEQLTSTRA